MIIAQTEPLNATQIQGPLSVVTDGNEQVGNITGSGIVVGGAFVRPTLVNNATIATNVEKASVAPTAGVTGIILAPGTVDGQHFFLTNLAATGGYTVTFATAATSNVQGGTGVALAITSGNLFVWDAAAGLWYLC